MTLPRCDRQIPGSVKQETGKCSAWRRLAIVRDYEWRLNASGSGTAPLQAFIGLCTALSHRSTDGRVIIDHSTHSMKYILLHAAQHFAKVWSAFQDLLGMLMPAVLGERKGPMEDIFQAVCSLDACSAKGQALILCL